jgi:hypothetical protein
MVAQKIPLRLREISDLRGAGTKFCGETGTEFGKDCEFMISRASTIKSM